MNFAELEIKLPDSKLKYLRNLRSLMMNVCLLFRSKEEEYFCDYIYYSESGMVYSFSFDDDYIVKNEEKSIKDLKHLEELYPEKGKGKKGKISSVAPILIKKDYADVKAALYYLGGTLEDFKEGIPARKNLPEIINPYDLDFDEEKDSLEELKDLDLDLNEKDILDEFNNDDDEFDNLDYDDDPYR